MTSKKKINLNQFVEFFLLIGVMLCLGFLFIGNNIKDSPEAKRYQYDIHSKFGYPETQDNPYVKDGVLDDRGIIIDGKLSQLCGSEWYNDFYASKSRYQRLQKLDNCQIPQGTYKEVLQQAQTNLNNLQGQIKAKYVFFNQKNIDIDEKGVKKDSNKNQIGQEYFVRMLDLGSNGKSSHLTKFSEHIKTLGDNPQLDKNTVLAVLAASEGDTLFPYSKVFLDNADLSQQYNDVARYIRKIDRINLDWANKAVSTQTILNSGFLWFCIMAFSAYFCIFISRSRKYKSIILSIIIGIWVCLYVILAHNKGMIDILSSKWLLFFISPLAIALMLFVYLMERYNKSIKPIRSTATSSLGYPCFVLFLGIGTAILLDLSVRGHLDNRFIIYNHYQSIFWSFVVISVIPISSTHIASFVSRLYSIYTLRMMWSSSIKEKTAFKLLVVLFAILPFVVSQFLSSNNLIEISKVWIIILSSAYLMSLRILPALKSKLSLNRRFVLTILYVFGIPTILVLLAQEIGTLISLGFLIFLLFLALFTSAKKYRLSLILIVSFTTLLVFGKSILSGFARMFDKHHILERINSWVNPYQSTNDQMAIIGWFQNSIPTTGYDLGEIPWCGYRGLQCYVPKQMQSDYTATSLMLLFGSLSIILLIFYTGWLFALAYNKWQVTKNISLISQEGISQTFLSWVAVIWATITVTQFFVTAYGNVGILPLTGVPLPFLGYGMSNMLVSVFFLALIINSPKTSR